MILRYFYSIKNNEIHFLQVEIGVQDVRNPVLVKMEVAASLTPANVFVLRDGKDFIAKTNAIKEHMEWIATKLANVQSVKDVTMFLENVYPALLELLAHSAEISVNVQIMEQLYAFIPRDNVSAHQIGMEILVKNIALLVMLMICATPNLWIQMFAFVPVIK